ncbi:hypothetical protein [Hymenobacter actinosclerus]|uniref:Type I restriction enzyme R protein N terminus (HSDR_N) n=1 Tax=Hymenobacter actinosclerus TaxID=82805 RepID=A0A1I0J805_9BACT|nr:hypothetical protein [Hymenobacter actinosclerus]SEU05956.1 hypothetical protein SAMN04487998_3695 [Hymenobacter actinosclerus]
MPIPSPLATLYAVLQAVRTSAEINSQLLRKNEAATRAALIDPVLRALGWDTADVRMVEPERTIGGELRVDYLLHDSNGNPRLVVEAKCLGASLDKHGYVSKVLGYALGFKVQTVFITDGLQWHCYSNLHKGNTEVIAFSLVEGDLLNAALELIQWLDAARSGHGVQVDENRSINNVIVDMENKSDIINDIPNRSNASYNSAMVSFEMKTIVIQLGKTYYNRGFFNIQTKHRNIFGGDLKTLDIQLGSETGTVIKGDINRTHNKDGRPRIMGGKILTKWMKDNFLLDEEMKVDIISSNLIRLYK